MAFPDLPFDPNFALDRYLSSVDTKEDKEMEGATCMELIVASMRELQNRKEGVNIDSLKEYMSFEYAFNVMENQQLLERSIKDLISKRVVRKRGQWYDLVKDIFQGMGKISKAELKETRSKTEKDNFKDDNVEDSFNSESCKKLIIKSLEELENNAVHFQKLTHHMAFEHGFNIIANENLIKISLKELRNEGKIM